MANIGAVAVISPTSPSFFTAPLRIVDQEYHGVGSVALDIDFRFGTFQNKLQNKTPVNTFVNVPNQNQWKDDFLAAPSYSVRHISLEGDGVAIMPAINIWRTIDTTRTFGIQRPAPGTSRFITIRVELAESADLSTVLASALLTLRYTRP